MIEEKKGRRIKGCLINSIRGEEGEKDKLFSHINSVSHHRPPNSHQYTPARRIINTTKYNKTGQYKTTTNQEIRTN